MSYNAENHHGMDGYQNPTYAEDLAGFVIATVLKKYDSIINSNPINLIGIDNSSTFLAAFVKMKQPNWNFVSASKQGRAIKGYFSSSRNLVFCDDYLAFGEATTKLINTLAVSSYMQLHHIDIFYIKTSHSGVASLLDFANDLKAKYCRAFSNSATTLSINVLQDDVHIQAEYPVSIEQALAKATTGFISAF